MPVQNVRILIVDDEPGIRALLREILLEDLDSTTCPIVEAPDGKVALDLLGQREFDIVVTDIKMPLVDGLTLLQEVKKRYPRIEVIVMTGYTEDYSREEAIRLGARDYITKPFDVDEVGMILLKSCLKAEGERRSDAPGRTGP